MKKKIHFYVFLLFTFLVQSQTIVIDSLTKVVNNSKSENDKAKALNAIAIEYKATNPELMAKYANQALSLSKKIGNKYEEGCAYNNLGNSNIILGKYVDALNYFTSAQIIFKNEIYKNPKSLESKKGLAKAYGSIGIVFSEKSNYPKAIEYSLKSVKIYEEVKDEVMIAKLYNNIGLAHRDLSNISKALEYFNLALKIQVKLKEPNPIIITNIANCHLKLKNYDKAFDYYNKAKNLLDKSPNPRALGEWYNNFGLFFKETKNEDFAIKNWNSAITSFESINDKFGLSDTYLYLGQLYLNQNKLDLALQNAYKSLKLSSELGILEQTVHTEKLISDIYVKKNNSNQALLHYKLYSKAKDSLINSENIRKGVELAMNYEYDKKQLIQNIEKEKRELLFKEKTKQNKMELFFASLFGILLFGIGFLIYSKIQLRKNLTLQKELAEYEQKALHLQMNPHFVFNCLGSISSFIVNNGTESAIKYLAKFSKLMRLTLEYSKESLIPIDREIESLQNYLELEQLRFNSVFDFTILKSTDIEDDMALPTLLVQPFVENAIIHGVVPKKVKGTVDVKFTIEDDSLLCIIEDSGVGYNQSKSNKENTVIVHKSMAMDITKKRLEMIVSKTGKQAFCTIDEIQVENKIVGTKVVLHLPIQYLE